MWLCNCVYVVLLCVRNEFSESMNYGCYVSIVLLCDGVCVIDLICCVLLVCVDMWGLVW